MMFSNSMATALQNILVEPCFSHEVDVQVMFCAVPTTCFAIHEDAQAFMQSFQSVVGMFVMLSCSMLTEALELGTLRPAPSSLMMMPDLRRALPPPPGARGLSEGPAHTTVMPRHSTLLSDPYHKHCTLVAAHCLPGGLLLEYNFLKEKL